jgi:glycosyltransferase involved in cell wall biosynthesis
MSETAHRDETQGSSVGVVIRSLNEAQHIGRLLIGLSNQTVQPDRVVLVDSGSTDATVEIAKRFGVQVESIAPEFFSFGRSLNLGCAALDTDLIVIVSAHIYPVYDSWLERLIKPFADDFIALSYGRQVGDHRTRFSEQQLMRRWFPETSVARQTHPFCNNANAAVRRDVWADQPYDEDITGLEDIEWAGRAIEKGYGISYVAESAVVHVHEESWDRLRNRYRREAIAHRRIYETQRLRAVEALALGARHVVTDYGTAVRQRVLVRNLVSIPSFHAAQFLGAYQGFAQNGEIPTHLKRRFYYPVRTRSLEPDGVTIGQRIDYSAQEKLDAHC